MSEITEEHLARARRATIAEMTPQQWTMWQHNPVTAAFLQFQDDQIAHWRELAADLLEAGAFQTSERHEDRNPDVVRGKILAMRGLRGITIEAIQAFYGQEPGDAEAPAQP